MPDFEWSRPEDATPVEPKPSPLTDEEFDRLLVATLIPIAETTPTKEQAQ